MSAPVDATVRFELRGANRDFLLARDLEVVLAGPAGTGKTIAALLKLHLTALKVPGLRALVLRQTHTMLTGTTLRTFDELVTAEAQAAGLVRFHGGSPREPAMYRYGNGSRIMVGGLDRGADRYMSAEYDRVFIDEANQVTETDVEKVRARLRGHASTYKQLAMCTNPDSPTHFLRQRETAGTLRMLHSRYVDNPHFAHADGTLTAAGTEYLAILDGLSGVRRARLLDGRWVAAEGVIYEGWQDAVHLVEPFEIPASWPRYWAVDFGYSNPLVIQCWAEDPDGRLYLYRELYRTGRLVEDHARDILDIVAPGCPACGGTARADCSHPGRRTWAEPRPAAVVCDHDAEDRATLERHLGVPTRPAKKDVSPGIQAVQSRLKVAGDGKPRLFVFRNSLHAPDSALVEAHMPTCFVDEIGGYVWDGTKEKPVKQGDHAMDAARYLVMERESRGTVRVRFL